MKPFGEICTGAAQYTTTCLCTEGTDRGEEKHNGYSVSMLSLQFIINSRVKFAVCEVRNFSPARCEKKHGVTRISMLSQVLTKAAGRARMQKMRKVCHSKCTAFSVSVLSHASVTPNLTYGKLLHVRI